MVCSPSLNKIEQREEIVPNSSHFPVFNVTDCNGNKLWDEEIISYIKKVLIKIFSVAYFHYF